MSVTRGADHAVATAWSCSDHEGGVPGKITVPPRASTDRVVHVQPGIAPERAADGLLDVGLAASLISLLIPTSPSMLLRIISASARWKCQAAVPVRVTRPRSTVASTVAGSCRLMRLMGTVVQPVQGWEQ